VISVMDRLEVAVRGRGGDLAAARQLGQAERRPGLSQQLSNGI